MKNPEVYKQQALYWQNYRIIDRTVTACVHLEDKNDIDFWDKFYKSIVLETIITFLIVIAAKIEVPLGVSSVLGLYLTCPAAFSYA